MPLEYGLWGPMNRILDFPVDFSTGRNTFGVIFGMLRYAGVDVLTLFV